MAGARGARRMNSLALGIVGGVGVLLLMLLGFLAFRFYRIDPPDIRNQHLTGLLLKLVGMLLIASGFVLHLSARFLAPLLWPEGAWLPALQRWQEDLGWPLVFVGFMVFC